MLRLHSATPSTAGARIFANSNFSIDGTQAYITANSFGSGIQGCYVYSSIVADFATSRQLEVGSYRCFNGVTLDTTCPGTSLASFGESWRGGTDYTCTAGPGATGGVPYRYTVQRTGTASTAWAGYRDGTQYWGLQPFSSPTTANIRIYEWAEATSPQNISGCAWAGNTHFGSWQRYRYGTGWTTVGTSDILNDGCWTVSGLSTGNFDVFH